MYTMKVYLLGILGLCAGHVLFTLLRSPYVCDDFVQTLPLFNRTRARILCYINTHPPMYEKRAIHVQNTWARKCDKFFFTSTQPHPNLTVLLLNLSVPEIRSHLWIKMRSILRELYKIADDYDYFYKGDDDTYVIVDNLRAMLWQHKPEEAFLTGYRWNALCPGGYFSGGAGYAFSRETLKRLVELAIDKHPGCPRTDEDKEDVKMSLCGRAVGVKTVNTIGETGRSLFFPYSPIYHFSNHHGGSPSYWDRFYPEKPYLRRPKLEFSHRHISFHYMEPKLVYVMEFLQYFMNPLAPRVDSKQKLVDQ